MGDSAAIGAADTITGGAGTDTANMFISDDESINASGVEIWNINASAAKTFNFAGVTDATTIVSKSSADLDVTNIKSNATLGAVGVSGHDATDDFLVTFASGAVGSTTGTLSLEVDGAGTKGGNRFEFDVSVASTATESFSTLNVKGSNNASYIEVDDATAGSLALTKVVFTGGAMVDLGDAPSNFANVATVDASAATGGTKIDLATSSNAKDVTFTGGTGDDTVVFAAAGFTVADKIAGGDGTGDAIFTGDAVFTATTDAVVKAFNSANTTGVEIAGSTVTAGDGIQIKSSVFSNINTFAFGSGGLTPAANAANAAGDVAATLSGIESGDSFVILGSITGGTSAAGDSNGGDAINATPLVNSGSDELNLIFKAGAATTITGGAGQDTSGAGEVNGDGLDAATIEKINITTNSAQDDVTFAAGTTGSGTVTAGASVKVGANATITITGAGDVNLGTIVAPSTDADDLTIDGSAMTGKLTVTTGAGNDIIKGGSKGDAITWGAGTNTATGNGGSDTYNVAAGNAVGAQDKVTDFTAGSGGDKLDLIAGSDTKSYDALTSAEQTAVDAETSLANAVNTALVGATNSQWTAFTYGGKTYAVYDTDDTFDTTNGYLVELTGVTVANLTADNFA